MAKKKKKKKLKFKGLLFILLIIYLIVMILYYFFNKCINLISINGNNVLDSSYIKKIVEINDETKLWKVNKIAIKNKLKKDPLIKNVSVKKNIKGNIEINVEEYKILFYNLTNSKYVIENGKELDLNINILGKPTLINYVPKDIYNNFIKKMNKVDNEILELISEIEYNPSRNNDIVYDESRFIIKMNDKNTVHVNIPNFEKLNYYKKFYKAVNNDSEGKKGIFYLDSSRGNTVLFSSYDSIKKGDAKNDVKLS